MELLMDAKLNEVETDFIEFIAAKRSRPLAEIKSVFCETKERFKFTGPEYAKLTGQIPHLHRILYDTTTEEDTVHCYQVHELLHLFAYISYSYPKLKSSYLKELRRDLKKGEWRNIYNFIRRKLAGRKKQKGIYLGPRGIANFLTDAVNETPIVVDYGSGLAYISYEIAKANTDAKIFLVDIDCLVQEFAVFRLKKIGADVRPISVTKTNLYPELPPHNICIASEVMEHVAQPLKVYGNILKALQAGGAVYGDFDDHPKNMWHISTDLSQIRQRISEDFQTLEHRCYKRVD